MLVVATSEAQLATLVIAGVAAASGIVSALVSGVFGTRSAKRAERLANEAEARADTRARQLEERETQREAEHWRLERLRTAYDQCVALAEQGLITLQQFALSLPQDLDERTAERRALHPAFVALVTRIAFLGHDMNAIGERKLEADLGLGVATMRLIESLAVGQAELAPNNQSGTAQGLMDAFKVVETGLKEFRLTMRGPLYGVTESGS